MCLYTLFRWRCRHCGKVQRELQSDWERCSARPHCTYRPRGPPVDELVMCSACQRSY